VPGAVPANQGVFKMYSSKKIVSDLSKIAVNRRMRKKGFSCYKNSKLSRWMTTYWKPGHKDQRILVIFKGNYQKAKAKATASI
jgi:hypothetical protein